jgi:hypothetical protein
MLHIYKFIYLYKYTYTCIFMDKYLCVLGIKINEGLLELGKVVSALSKKEKASYRGSKLTR